MSETERYSLFLCWYIFCAVIYFWVDIYSGGIYSCAPQVCSVCCLNASEIGEESSANGKESLTDVDKQCVPCHTHDNDDHDDPGNNIKMFPFKFAFCQHLGGIDLLNDISYAYICLFLFAYCIVFLFDIYDNFKLYFWAIVIVFILEISCLM